MGQLHFTTRVLGPLAALRLEGHQITQTLRSASNSIPKAILSGQLKVSDQIEVTLDGKVVGHAEYVIMDFRRWIDIDLSDARRGGFDTVPDLWKALQRAGYRFKPMDMYQLYRVQFRWLEFA